jgi:hypothetical protein
LPYSFCCNLSDVSVYSAYQTSKRFLGLGVESADMGIAPAEAPMPGDVSHQRKQQIISQNVGSTSCQGGSSNATSPSWSKIQARMTEISNLAKNWADRRLVQSINPSLRLARRCLKQVS